MNKLLNGLAIFILAAAGAGGMIYLDRTCPEKKADQQKQIDMTVEQYVNNNSQAILENIAKSENFGDIVKNFSTISDEEIGNKIKDYIENNPAIIEDFIRNNADFVANSVIETEAFKNAVASHVSTDSGEAENNDEQSQDEADETQKFHDHWDEMRNSKVAPFVGPEDAQVAVVEFFDFACSHCKSLAPVMSELMRNNPDVKFVFQPLYFISDHSNYAAKVSLAAAQKGKFVEVFDGVMTLPEMNEETINQILVDEGLNVDEIKEMIEEKSIRRGSQDIDALSQVLGINGVPMLIINGEPFNSRSLEAIQNKINSYK